MISVIVPALNEELTIANVIRYCQQFSHVSEIIVIDDNSTDNTASIAAKAGATVLTSAKPGKGISMAEGVAAAKNEILVFLDADIDPYPKSTIPLLTRPIISGEFDFIKANFTRNAGRVTEIMAKPLLAIFYPDLLFFSQPLSGMIAGRKKFFQKIDFFNDYGVDIGILIDMYLMQARIKEVEIGYLENKSKPWHALPKMSLEVAKAIVAKATQHRKEKVTSYTADTLHAIASSLGALIHPEKKEKMLIFDMDNTILRGRFIDECAWEYGFTDKLQKLRAEEKDPGTLTKRIALLLKGLSISDLLKTAARIPMVDDINEVVRQFKSKGYKVGIISDSYQVVTNFVQHKIDADFNYSNQLDYFEGRATGEVKVPSYFYRGSESICEHHVCKTNALLHICREQEIAVSDCIVVGDSENDRCIIKNAGVGVAFCTNDDLLTLMADKHISEPSFAPLLGFT
ncbi:MAG: HAD-IB family phosphatase [Gemmatimonadaceae bacterium]|nr:HAD-IB family phosphatase [Chitinophagaceae bacterium]